MNQLERLQRGEAKFNASLAVLETMTDLNRLAYTALAEMTEVGNRRCLMYLGWLDRMLRSYMTTEEKEALVRPDTSDPDALMAYAEALLEIHAKKGFGIIAKDEEGDLDVEAWLGGG